MWYELVITVGGAVVGSILTLIFGEPIKECSKRMTKKGRREYNKEKILSFLLKTKQQHSLEEINKNLFRGKMNDDDLNILLDEIEKSDKRIKTSPTFIKEPGGHYVIDKKVWYSDMR
ncbi:hypothetical protein J26TS2_01210 [Shouchella clausii]|nr:hypothetical protein J26TS2_01210 [Shouchella clausii]